MQCILCILCSAVYMQCCVMEILFSVVECVEECCAMEKLCDGDSVEECCAIKKLLRSVV